MSDYSRRNTMGGANRSGGGSPPDNITALRVISKNGVTRLFSDSNTVTIEALAELKTKGLSREFAGDVSIYDKCEETINAIGFTFVEKEELSPGIDVLRNYSLIGSTNIDETIKNSRIVDPNLDKLTPIKQATTDKFKSESDPFYELDQERPESVKKIVNKEKRVTHKSSPKVAKRIVQIARKSPNKTLSINYNRGLI